MRIAVLSVPPSDSSGWGRYTCDLITNLAALGIQIVLITSKNAPAVPGLPVAEYHRVLPPLYHPARLMSLRLVSSIPAVERLTVSCEVTHVIAEPYTLAVPSNRRLIVTAHGSYIPKTANRRLLGALYRAAYRRAAIICVSNYTRNYIDAAVPGLRLSVIPNGVDEDYFQRPGIAPVKNGPTVLAVGQVKPRKGFHVLVESFAKVRQTLPDAQLVIIGDTSYRSYFNALQAQIAREQLTGSAHLLGRVSDDVLLGWYHAADVFALPAINTGDKFEGFGLVYMEANAAGLPTVGTLGCGAEDVIRDGETGFLVPQNDATATADALLRLLTDPALRATMCTNARAYAQEYGWRSIAERVIKIYEAEAATHP